jgi:hypothetical protein
VLTCVLPKLVHGLQVDDVGDQLGVHLPQDHRATGVFLEHVFDVVAHGGRVGPPAAVFIQPLPHHHPSHVLRREAQAVPRHHHTLAWP